jgi:hypothetical protein
MVQADIDAEDDRIRKNLRKLQRRDRLIKRVRSKPTADFEDVLENEVLQEIAGILRSS